MALDRQPVFVQTGLEAPETNPPYLALFPQEAGTKAHVFGWVHADNRTNEVVRVHGQVHDRHPITHLALRQSLEAEGDDGRIFGFNGEALALSPVPAWPGVSFHHSVYRWEDERGRVSYASCQEAWFAAYQRHLARNARQLREART